MSTPSVREKLDRATEYKEKGNALFKRGKFKKAIKKYAFVFAWVTGLPGQKMDGEAAAMSQMMEDPAGTGGRGGTVTEEEEEEAKRLQVIVRQNQSLCYFKLGKFAESRDMAQKAVRIDAESWKGHIRVAEAAIAMNDLDAAEAALANAEKCPEANTVAIRKSQQRLAKALARFRAKERKKYGGFFLDKND